MRNGQIFELRLDSWKAIAQYVGRDVRTVIRWEKERGFPVRRIPGGKRQTVFAYAGEIENWLRNGLNSESDTDTAGGTVTAPELLSNPLLDDVQIVVLAGPTAKDKHPRSRLSRQVWVLVYSITLLAVCAAWVMWLSVPTTIHVVGDTQITDDNTPKLGLVTDGSWVYFDESKDGREALIKVSAQGGPEREIPTPFHYARPEDISNDGRRLLVLAWDSVAQVERELWVVPVDASKPLRAGEILCHSASWSPDNKLIAFATGNAISLISEKENLPRQIYTSNGIPNMLRWSPNGQYLQFQLVDPKSGDATFQELALSSSENPDVKSVVLTHITFDSWEYTSKIQSDGDREFVSSSNGMSGRILLIERPRLWRRSNFPLSEVRKSGTAREIAADARSRRLFVISRNGYIDELDQFDRNTREFIPFLPGVSAEFVDFSHDGHWITYVRKPENTLWVSRADGNLARQISIPPYLDVELPRWSPDNRTIAFMARAASRPYRIFAVRADGGKVEEVSHGTDNQGAPTWSPDGRWLAYGNVECFEAGTCAVHRIEISTGREYAVPGSEGLETARWSPDGRFIAALQPGNHAAYLFDIRTQRWRKIAEGVNGNDLAWSADSRSLYASRTVDNRPQVVRIWLDSGKLDLVVDLSDFTKLVGQINTWFTVAPDQSIIFLHETGIDEIHALDYR